MTANDVYEIACALMDEIDSDGEVNEDTGYEGRAPMIINALQHELAHYEGVNIMSNITSLNDTLEISDDTAERVMPYGLAAKFALSDRMTDEYNEFSSMYRMLIRQIGALEDIEDEYDVLDGMR